MIDWTFRLSDLASVTGFFLGGISGALLLIRVVDKIIIRISLLETKVETQSDKLVQFGEIITQYGRFDERLIGMQRQIDDLKHGRGYVFDPPKGAR
jgi:hypothetical protein